MTPDIETPTEETPLLRERIPESWKQSFVTVIVALGIGSVLAWWTLESQHQVGIVEAHYTIQGVVNPSGEVVNPNGEVVGTSGRLTVRPTDRDRDEHPKATGR